MDRSTRFLNGPLRQRVGSGSKYKIKELPDLTLAEVARVSLWPRSRRSERRLGRLLTGPDRKSSLRERAGAFDRIRT
jgi:hypothetical protein